MGAKILYSRLIEINQPAFIYASVGPIILYHIGICAFLPVSEIYSTEKKYEKNIGNDENNNESLYLTYCDFTEKKAYFKGIL